MKKKDFFNLIFNKVLSNFHKINTSGTKTKTIHVDHIRTTQHENNNYFATDK